MTSPAAARLYEAQHLLRWEGKQWAFYNPNNIDIIDLPLIYGFNNGGPSDFLSACLIAEDGTWLGNHCCSSESYMPHDLGVIEGARLDRHAGFKAHYPNGYRMSFVSYGDVPNTIGLQSAFKLQS